MMKKYFMKISKLFLVISALSLIIFENSGCESQNGSQKLSIIVPAYNVADYIPTCLDSLIAQTYQNIEIICVNDGSTDNSLEILNQYKNKDNRIIVIDKKNGGVSSARNAGIEAATGEYLTFVDADDYIDFDAYEKCFKTINKNKADILAFNYMREPGHIVASPFKSQTYKVFDCLKEEFASNCTVWNKIFKRSILINENIRFAEDVTYGEDDLFLKMVLPNAQKIIGYPYPFYHYVNRGTSAENTYSEEKRLISAINRSKHFIEYYTQKNYKDEYNWVLTGCLDITYSRINSLDENLKKEYSLQILKILDEKLLPKIDNVPEEANEQIRQLRVYAEM